MNSGVFHLGCTAIIGFGILMLALGSHMDKEHSRITEIVCYDHGYEPFWHHRDYDVVKCETPEGKILEYSIPDELKD